MTGTASARPFENSDAGRLLMNSVQYLSMANLVYETETYRNNPLRYNRPILNSLAIGIELLLKFSYVHHGMAVDAVARAYRHNIWKLWEDCPEPSLANLTFEAAKQSYSDALAQGMAEPSDDLRAEFGRALRNLSNLHTTGGSQLRYLAPPDVMATRPGWLIETYFKVAMACLHRPPFGPRP